MPLFYFDVHAGTFMLDEDGSDLADLDAGRREAKRLLPALARDIFPQNGDHQTLTVRVRDDQHETVYTATLMFSGLVMPDHGLG